LIDKCTIFLLRLFVFFWLFSGGFHAYAQSTSKTKKESAVLPAVRQAARLKNGVLVVRMTSDRRKEMTLIEMAGENPSPDNMYLVKAEKLRSKRDSLNRDFINQFRTYYTFSRVEFFYDFDTPRVRNGETEGVFVDDNLYPSPDINIEGLARFVMTEDYNTDTGPVSYYILDENFQPLPPYFPYRFRKNNIWNVFFSIFDPRIDKGKKTEKIATKVHDELTALLNKYYYLIAM